MGHKIRTGMQQRDAKLTDEQVLEIRAKGETKQFTQKQLGEQYGVSPQTISKILRREKWTHI